MDLITYSNVCSTMGPSRWFSDILSGLARWCEGQVEGISPARYFLGALGHAWEELTLPRRLKAKTPLCLGDTGPMSVDAQVVTIHHLVPFDHPEWLPPEFAGWYRFLPGVVAKAVEHVIAVSDVAMSRIIQALSVPPLLASTIHNRVDSEFFAAGFGQKPTDSVESLLDSATFWLWAFWSHERTSSGFCELELKYK